jgi:pimeloyl-ACP methyl ester carboxylesterase
MPSVDEFDYTFDNLANIVEKFVQKIGLEKYSIYLMDYGAPVGLRLAAKHPDRVEALIVQNGNAYEEWIDNDFWKPLKEFTTDIRDPAQIGNAWRTLKADIWRLDGSRR